MTPYPISALLSVKWSLTGGYNHWLMHMLRLLFGEVKYKLVFRRQQRTFWTQNAKTCYIEWRFSAKQLCPIPCSWQAPHGILLQHLFLGNSKRTTAYPTNVGRTAWFQLSPPFGSFSWSWRSCLRWHSRHINTCTYCCLQTDTCNQLNKKILLIKILLVRIC